MAAGMGSRFGGLKQLAAVGLNGEALIDYALYDAKQAGCDEVIFIIRRDFEDVPRQHQRPRRTRPVGALCFSGHGRCADRRRRASRANQTLGHHACGVGGA